MTAMALNKAGVGTGLTLVSGSTPNDQRLRIRPSFRGARKGLAWSDSGSPWTADSILNGATAAEPNGGVAVGQVVDTSGQSVVRACVLITTTQQPGYDPTAVLIGWVADIDGTIHSPVPVRNMSHDFQKDPWTGNMTFPLDGMGSRVPSYSARQVLDFRPVSPSGFVGSYAMFIDVPAWFAAGVRLFIRNHDNQVPVYASAKYMTGV